MDLSLAGILVNKNNPALTFEIALPPLIFSFLRAMDSVHIF